MSIGQQLATLPDGVDEASGLISGFDDCLNAGFARLSEQNRSSLALLTGTLAQSPLAQPLSNAVAAVERSEYLVRHFCVLAAARSAIQGAQYDALRDQLLAALAIESADAVAVESKPPGSSAAALGSVQQWLMEMAITGFHHLEEATIAPFMATLENLQDDSELTGLASLLTGFINELLRHMPAEKQKSLPVYRWADLWAAAMIRTQQLTPAPAGTSVSGSVTLFGTDIRSHENFVAVNVYGTLQTGDDQQTIRIPLTGYKVDAVKGVEIWDLFGDERDPILKSLEWKKSLKVEKAELRANGDLFLSARPKLGRAADPFVASDGVRPLPAVPALIRHPVHLAELVCVDGDHDLPIAVERLPADTELTEAVMKAAEQVIGLVRFDAGTWRLQPLCVRTAKATVVSGESLFKVRAKLKSNTLSVLRERAGKLLRG